MYDKIRTLARSVPLIALVWAAAPWASACAFHGYDPDPTLVDVLMGSEHIVLARPDPRNPKQYAAVSALVGPLDAVDLQISVDPVTRARLASNPSHTALIARDGSYGPWIKLAVLDDSYQSVIDTVVARKDDWILGGDEDRYQVFADLLIHPTADVQLLALAELDRADYSLLQDLRLPSIPTLEQDLASGDPFLRPIRLLLAGLSNDAQYSQMLTSGMDKAARDDVAYLGAYATALIELGGSDAVRYIEQRFLAPGVVSLQTNEKIIEALAIHKQTASMRTKKSISKAVSNILGHTPLLAGAVARQFGTRGDWAMEGPLKRAIADQPPQSIADIFAVNQYLGIAVRGANQ